MSARKITPANPNRSALKSRGKLYLAIATLLIVSIFTVIVFVRSDLSEQFSNIESTSAQTTSNITIDANAKVADFTPRHLGVGMLTWEHVGSGSYPDQIPGLADAFKAAGVGLIRYAGGNYVHTTFFDRSIIDYNYGTPIPAQYQGKYTRPYAVNELAALDRLAKAVGAEVMIQVNLKYSEPAMWADLVRLAKERGWTSFKYYELSNENDCCEKSVTSTMFWQRTRDYMREMKAVDSTIKIIGPAPAVGWQNWNGDVGLDPEISNYINPFFAVQKAGLSMSDMQNFHGVTWHWYSTWVDYNSKLDIKEFSNYNNRKWAHEFPQKIKQKVQTAEFSYLTQGVTEVNIEPTHHYRPYAGSYMTALFATDALPRLASGGTDFTTWYAGYGGDNAYSITHPTFGGGGGARVRPTFSAFALLANFFGDSLVSSTYTDKENLGVWASRDSADNRKLYVLVTNFQGIARSLSVNLQNYTARAGKSYTMRNTNPTVFEEDVCGSWQNGVGGETRKCIAEPATGATQYVTSINNVVLRGASFPSNPLTQQVQNISGVAFNVSGNNFTYNFEPYTATVLELTTDTTQPPPSAVASTTPSLPSAIPSPVSSATPPVLNGGIKVQGNRIVNSSGQAVQLVGVNNSGMEYACTGDNGQQGYGFHDGSFQPNQQTINTFKSWNMNAVRITLNETCWLGINGVTAGYSGQAYRNEVTKYVNILNQNGMVAILDAQWNVGNPHIATSLAPMPNRDNSLNFWLSVNETFKGNNMVIFDLHNEAFPNNNVDSVAAWQCWRDATNCTNMTTQKGQAFTPIGFQELVTKLRSSGATQIILLSGVRYSLILSRWLEYKPVDPLNNLAAAWHAYHTHRDSCGGQNSTCWQTILNDVARTNQQVPVISGEIGNTDGNSSFTIDQMKWMDERGIGYLGWTWNTWGNGQALISNYNGTPTAYGQAIRAHFQSRPTSPISSTTPSAAPSSAPNTSLPYGGVAPTVPTRLEAENYDEGGAGIAYFDKSTGNNGNTYRTNDVDVESNRAGGLSVGWIEQGEWLNYSFDVDSAGSYTVSAAVASANAAGKFTVTIDGKAVGEIVVPNSGNWFGWSTVQAGIVDLNVGKHLLRITASSGNASAVANLDYINILSQQVSEDINNDGKVNSLDFGYLWRSLP